MQENRLTDLFNKFIRNEATEEEQNEFLDLVGQSTYKDAIQQLMEDYWKDFTPASGPFTGNQRDEMLSNIFDSDKINTTKRTKTRYIWKYITTAAAILIVVGAGLIYRAHNSEKNDTTIQDIAKSTITPGKIGATLTLANGQEIRLSDAMDGQLAEEAGVVITKSADGQLIYEILDGTTEADRMNTLSTAKGETYQVRLPDGSMVWLNAASSLTYSANLIKDGRRTVKLEGEGYFEIAKDKAHPFIVESNGQQVEVLGTHFNVNAYADEGRVTTTLLEGSVKINEDTYLKPGQQSILRGNNLKVIAVNGETETAWKNGRFSFTGKDFKSLMRTISRWYNVEIVYGYEPVNLRIGGGISRFENIGEVLELIQETGDVTFKIEGRRVIVMK